MEDLEPENVITDLLGSGWELTFLTDEHDSVWLEALNIYSTELFKVNGPTLFAALTALTSEVAAVMPHKVETGNQFVSFDEISGTFRGKPIEG